MTTHDVLAFAVATDTVARIRNADPEWSHVFSPNVHVTTSRDWPQPDFVLSDAGNDVALAAEFKPPGQTKREYLTGLGQSIAYTHDFSYAALVVPVFAEDGYPIANHLVDILAQPVYDHAPVAVLSYDPAVLAPANAGCDLVRQLVPRADAPARRVTLDASFYAKWREASPLEIGLFLDDLYAEGRRGPLVGGRSIRDRAWDVTWQRIVSGGTISWSGNPRNVTDNPVNRAAWSKNFRNFLIHLGWIWADGSLTEEGFHALHTQHRYGSGSQVFNDRIATTLLLDGKHLVLINAINQFQDLSGPFARQQTWLDGLEQYLEDEGLLKRNAGRHQAAAQGVNRGFLKAEKTLWRELGLIVPNGPRVFFPGRGFIFNWERITSLLA